MRNLKLRYCKELATEVTQAKQLLLQPENSRDGAEITYLVTDCRIYLWNDAEIAPKVIAELPDIVSAEYLQLDNSICVATGAGEVMLINTDNYAAVEGTFCDVGIESMAWSPNQEVVAFITKTYKVVVMTCTYEVIGEEPLEAELTSDQQFVNVGWGKKETQFHGKAGKEAAKQPHDFQAPQNMEELPQDVHISWRGDGAFFTVSFVSASQGRTFKVYDCEGKLQHSAEKCNALQPVIAWRPVGNWIALPQLFPNKSTVALFEKNGLRHRDFTLPFDLQQEPIQQMRWSADSDILALQTKTPEAQRIYLYTIGNYHWYLKQVLTYEPDDPLVLLQWDTRLGAEHTLHVILASGKQLIHRWQFAVDRYERSGVVGVIDGKKLLLTDFAKAVVPPPMCQRALELDNYINAFTWYEASLCVYTCDRQLHLFYEPMQGLNREPLPVLLTPDPELSQIQLSNLTYFNCDYLLATHSVGNSTRLLLLNKEADPEEDDENPACYKVQSSLRISGTVNALTVGANAMDEFFVQTYNNAHTYQVSLKPDNTLKVERSYVQLSQPADQIEWYTLTSDSTGGLITLRSQQSLHIDGQRINEDVTSFCLAGNYLAYTQLNSLHFVRLRDKRHVSSRNIERGAKLVTTVANEARVVLQLPRGNLEAICPRVLTLELVGALLQQKKYQAAMEMLRKQRINLNIICDHNVEQFVASVDIFLREIKQTQWLCLFLSELQNEDFSKGMYASNYEAEKQKYPANYSVERKVEFICQLLCERMELATQPEQEAHFRLPIITAYVKLGQLERALMLIWRKRQQEAGDENINDAAAEELLKYLLYLVDVNDLYNVALGTYDFGLVLFVAQKSQKDPKEFLPYLNELKSLESNYRKFRIDEHLKRYNKALTHLAACGETHYEESLLFIKRHALYSHALECYKEQVEFYRQICVAYADHLRSNARLDNASIMYERGGQLTQALLSSKHILDWRRVLMLAQRTGEDIKSVALSLVPLLQEQTRHLEAHELLKSYSDDSVAQLEVLLNGHLFLHAIYEARMVQPTKRSIELLDEHVEPALINYAEKMQSSLIFDKQLFADYKQRLLDIRKRQALHSGDEYPGAHNDIEEVDLLSDTSSMHSSRYSGTSRGTGKTFRSSKNRRKHERKLLSLKPGNPFEDIALIDALHNHVTKISQQQQHVRDTCKAMLGLDGKLDALAASLQREYQALLTTIEESLDEIWMAELVGTGMPQHLTGPNVDYMALQKEQRYALINPIKRFKPQLNIIDWQHEILQ
ncbi:putative elongator complex protein 1 [Scaptodrosophila lebanonensis]|uniref:Elongator complex protein 1 n=1 Tax=Drosophila lebanonensis TaxID=7225 RepID=A0A6J2TGI5_DROLE|nr:putative elongator complex protein 1 [Scaptodrosophila lebanonensis]